MTNTNLIAVDRIQVRRNITLTGKPEPRHIDSLIRNGFKYDERAQQWWKLEYASAAPKADALFSCLDWQEAVLRQEFDFAEPSEDDHRYRFQSYYTPDALAAELVELADIQPSMTVLEPSAGHGAIAKHIKGKTDNLKCVEIDLYGFTELDSLGFKVEQADFLTLTPTAHFGTFDRIVMNPPFSRDQDARHVTHAFQFLKPGGKLVAIMGHYALNGRGAERERFARLMTQHGRVVRELPPGTFDNNARAVIVEISKPCLTS